MMQVSGLGNSLNGLASLAVPYQIPLPDAHQPTGELGEFNPAQIPMGQGARRMLEALGIQHYTLRRLDEVAILTMGPLRRLILPSGR